MFKFVTFGALAVGMTAMAGIAGAGDVKGPTIMDDAQLDNVVAGRLMAVYVNNDPELDEPEFVLKPLNGKGSIDHTKGFEGNGNWTVLLDDFGAPVTCETSGGFCAAYENPEILVE